MNKRRGLEIGTMVVAFVLSIVAVTVAFAAYTRNLTIKGGATVADAKWRIIFKDLSAASLTNSAGLTCTAREISHPQIVDLISIETYSVELKTPGDTVSYTFKIRNDGDFPAQVTSFSMPTPTCQKGASGGNNDATNVCGNLEYTLKYTTADPTSVPAENRVAAGQNVATGDKYTPGQEREVQLKLYYKSTATEAQLPIDDVTVSNLNITIPFTQY